MKLYGFVGIDFGTCNSHFAYCNVNDSRQAEPLAIGQRGSSVSTCVLWKDTRGVNKDDILGFGDEALVEWQVMEKEKRNLCRLAANFKPDIEKSERARIDAWAFLSKAYEETEVNSNRTILGGQVGDAHGRPVVVGVPAEITPRQKEITAKITQDAGFGKVTCIEEPLGALAFHVAKNHITAEDSRRGVLVVDFGGGTLDLALVDANSIPVPPWGDPKLGGRLFDDLFYQWLVKQDQIGGDLSPQDLICVWQVVARKIKEDFSIEWRKRGRFDTKTIMVYFPPNKPWVLRDTSVSEFRKMATGYKLSNLAASYFEGIGLDFTHVTKGPHIDLFNWIRETLAEGVRQVQGNFSKILLTGGSSSWPFMKELVQEVFSIDEKNIIVSKDPDVTIGSGLAIFNVLRTENERKRKKLSMDKEDRVSAFDAALSDKFTQYYTSIARDTVQLIVSQIETILLDWYTNGGSLLAVERPSVPI